MMRFAIVSSSHIEVRAWEETGSKNLCNRSQQSPLRARRADRSADAESLPMTTTEPSGGAASPSA
jgi:hypothetical protein